MVYMPFNWLISHRSNLMEIFFVSTIFSVFQKFFMCFSYNTTK